MSDCGVKRDPVVEVTLYSRPGCHLCDEARDALAGMGIEVDEVNIEEDEGLHGAFLERIPVVEVGGRVVSELVLDEPAIRAAITWAP
jgi:glutaredoxin